MRTGGHKFHQFQAAITGVLADARKTLFYVQLNEALAARLTAGRAAEQDTSADALWRLVGIAASRDDELSERVRDTIQQKVYENLVERGPAFL
jgi:hypothetical protein